MPKDNGMQLAGSMGMISVFVDDVYALKESQEKKKQWVLDEWQKTFNMPRKMKKARRKELRLDWTFANYEPFGGIFE